MEDGAISTVIRPEAGRRVAIVGGASSRVDAPYDDPSWEIWTFSSLRLPTPRITRWFEIHAIPDLRQQLGRGSPKRRSFREYMQFLRSLPCPVYMQEVHPSIPNSVRYPIEEVVARFGRCFSSTASYLIALAILEGFETIGVWGVHLTQGKPYIHQRPGVEYLLGVARRMGRDVYVPPASPLRIATDMPMPVTAALYGYEWKSPHAWWRKRRRRPSLRRRRKR